MILVVYSHVIYWGFKLDQNLFFNNYFFRIATPVFFFISAFLSYSYLDWESLKIKVNKRLKSLFLPSVIMLALFECWKGRWNLGGFCENMKEGYWFTFVLFEMFILLSLINYTCDKFNQSNIHKVLAYIILSIISIGITAIFVGNIPLQENRILQLLSIPQLFCYLPVFCFGMICKIYEDTFLKVVSKGGVALWAFLFFVFICNTNFLPQNLAGFMAPIFTFYIFKRNQNVFSCKTLVGSSMSYIGQHTLAIYFLHYFMFRFFVSNTSIHSFFMTIPNIAASALLMLTTFLVVAVCLLIEKIIMRVPPLYIVMFGPQK